MGADVEGKIQLHCLFQALPAYGAEVQKGQPAELRSMMKLKCYRLNMVQQATEAASSPFLLPCQPPLAE